MALTEEQYQEQLEYDRAAYQAEQESGEGSEENQPQNLDKMGILFFSIFLILCVVGDLIDLVTVGTLGWLVGLFIDGVVLLATGLSKAGRKQFKRIIIGLAGDSIPVLAILPFRSLFLTWAFINSRSSTAQKFSARLSKVSGISPVANKAI